MESGDISQSQQRVVDRRAAKTIHDDCIYLFKYCLNIFFSIIITLVFFLIIHIHYCVYTLVQDVKHRSMQHENKTQAQLQTVRILEE